MGRRNGIERIERRIARLRERAAEQLEHEQRTEARLEELRGAASAGRLRTARRARALARAQRRLETLRAERTQLVANEVRAIMLSLRDQSSRTRERLDRQLERMAPLEREWERLRSMFGTLEETLGTPALDGLAVHFQGALEIPEFPVTEQQGYVKPFPPKAILF
jgi:DNA repair exonuclease SbcCD ATPase subunit